MQNGRLKFLAITKISSSEFPSERKAVVLGNQDGGHHDVICKPAIKSTEGLGRECVMLGYGFTEVKRVKFAKVKRNTSKLRLLLSLSKV